MFLLIREKITLSRDTMGRATVTAKLENLEDAFMADRGQLPPDQVRFLEVPDALVDTGATQLSMPRRLIHQLGLRPVKTRPVRTSSGIVTVQVYDAVRLTVQGRDCLSDVSEVPDDFPVLLGQIILEQLDFVVDLNGQRLTGNPAHGGEHMIEMY